MEKQLHLSIHLNQIEESAAGLGEPVFEGFCFNDFNPLSRLRKKRTLFRPNKAMRSVHFFLLRFLRERACSLPHATGSRKGCSPIKNVWKHKKSRYLYLLDIEDAYLSVDGVKLAEVICSLDKRLLGWDGDLHQMLRKYCLDENGGLVIGAPASPDLFNLYLGKLVDPILSELCKRYGLTYTRYLDDFTFSSSKVAIGKRKRLALRQAIESAGFRINDEKTRIYDLRKGSIVVNGVGLEYGGRLFLPRHYLSRLRGMLHLAIKELKERKALPKKTLNIINGMIGIFMPFIGLRKLSQLNSTERKVALQIRTFRALVARKIMR